MAELRARRLKKTAELVEGPVGGTPTSDAFPDQHRRRWRTNNPLGRIIREIRRRTRVAGASTDGPSALNPAAARRRHIAGARWSTRRYLDTGPLRHEDLQTA